jgi:hypothetical protein
MLRRRMSELTVARITDVQEHPGARAPSYLLTLDVGRHGTHEVVLPTGTYEPAELRGAEILCRRDGDDLLVVAAHSHGRGLVLVRPDREVEPGTLVD